MLLIKEGKTNWKFLLIVFIFAIIAGGGILAYQYWLLPKTPIPTPLATPTPIFTLTPTPVTNKTPINTKAVFVYLTDEKYDGNLGGRSGADEKCTSPVGLNCESGTVHSLITVDKNDSIINMAKNYNLSTDIPVYWYNRDTKGTLILANNWNEMVGVNEESSPDVINGQEGTGKKTWSGDFPWTGGKGNIDSLSNCNQWTSNGGNLETAEGPYGTIGGVDKEFLFSSDGWAGISFSMVCKNQRYLRCTCEGNIR